MPEDDKNTDFLKKATIRTLSSDVRKAKEGEIKEKRKKIFEEVEKKEEKPPLSFSPKKTEELQFPEEVFPEKGETDKIAEEVFIETEETKKQETKLKEEYVSPPTSSQISKPVEKKPKTKLETLRKEEEMLLEEKQRLDQLLLELPQRRKPFEIKKEELEKEKNNYIEKNLEPVLNKEKEIEERKREIEKKERTAETPEKRREMEALRWKIEEEREAIEKQKWSIEEKVLKFEDEIAKNQEEIEKILLKEKEIKERINEILKRIEEINLEKEKENLKKILREKMELKDKLSLERSELILTSEGLKKQLEKVVKKEREIEEALKAFEEEEEMKKSIREKMEVEKQRWQIEKERKETEKERWEIEDKQKEIAVKIKKIELDYQEVSKTIEILQKKISEIEEKIPSDIEGISEDYEMEKEELLNKEIETKTLKEEPLEEETEISDSSSEDLKKKLISLNRKISEAEIFEKKTEELKEQPSSFDYEKEEKVLKKETETTEGVIRQPELKDFTSSFETENLPEISYLPKKPSSFERILVRFFFIILFISIVGISFWFLFSKITEKKSISPSEIPFEESEEKKEKEVKMPQVETEFSSETVPAEKKPEEKPPLSIPSSLIEVVQEIDIEFENNSQLIENINRLLNYYKIEEGKFFRIIPINLIQNRISEVEEILTVYQIWTPKKISEYLENYTLAIYSQKEGNRILLVAKLKEEKKEDFNLILEEWKKTIEKEGIFLSGKKIHTLFPKFKQTLYKNISVNFLTVSKNDLGICYTLFDNFFVFSTSFDSIKKVIDQLGSK